METRTKFANQLLRFLSALRWVGLAILILLVIGFIYQQQAQAADMRNMPRPGEMVDMGGYRLHLNCTGQGSPTVVLVAGAGDIWAIWEPVQKSLQQSTRVCSYDRPGLGLSDAHPDSNLTVEEQVTILHQLLHNANQAGPYIVVGHSIGGLVARTFAANYPKETGGVVLVDSSVGAQFAVLPSALIQSNRSAAAVFALCKVVAPFGLPRLLNLGNARAAALPGLSDEAKFAIAATFNASSGCAGLQADSFMSEEPLIKGTPPISLGNIPLTVITRGLNDAEDNPGARYSQDQVALFARVQTIWLDLQSGLLQLSSNSNQVIATHSGHYVHITEPELVASAVQAMLKSR